MFLPITLLLKGRVADFEVNLTFLEYPWGIHNPTKQALKFSEDPRSGLLTHTHTQTQRERERKKLPRRAYLTVEE